MSKLRAIQTPVTIWATHRSLSTMLRNSCLFIIQILLKYYSTHLCFTFSQLRHFARPTNFYNLHCSLPDLTAVIHRCNLKSNLYMTLPNSYPIESLLFDQRPDPKIFLWLYRGYICFLHPDASDRRLYNLRHFL